ncbi:MAG: hypothetical protein GF372_02895 [Candidatus Marinimicrobia bacterium]|nr:hypothetical protein [Candidatus Neomarinimicrobiota bacterium]
MHSERSYGTFEMIKNRDMISMFNVYFRVVLFTALFFSSAGLFCQDSKVIFVISDRSQIVVEGSSTLGSYEIDAREFSGRIALSDRSLPENDLQKFEQFEAASVTVNSDSLDAGGPLFNKHVRRTIQSEKYPEIRYHLRELIVSDKHEKPWKIIQAKGLLKVADVQQNIEITSRGYWPAESGPEFEGSVKIDMTQFGLEPPVLFFGALRTNKTVIVQYHLYLEEKP